MNRHMIWGVMLALLLSPLAFADIPTPRHFDEASVNVSVTSTLKVEISPISIKWENVVPGDDATTYTDVEKGTTGQNSIYVRNIGSSDIKTVWFNATAPSSNPFGTGTPGAYDVANFVLLSNASTTGNTSAAYTDNNYNYINLKEYREAIRDANGYTIAGTNIPYLQITNVAGRNYSVGRFHDGANEYFWALQWGLESTSNTGNCNKTSYGTNRPAFYVGLDAHNLTNLGDVNLTTNCESVGTCEKISGTGADGWDEPVGQDFAHGYFSLSTNRWQGAVVRPALNCESVELITWNKDTALDTISDHANFWAVNASASGTQQTIANFAQGHDLNDVLSPGEALVGYIKLRLPYGVPTGALTAGTISVIASSSNAV